jgi:hypothetical protein
MKGMTATGMRVGVALVVALAVLGVVAPRAEAVTATVVDLAGLAKDDPEAGEAVTLRATVRRSLSARPTGTVAFVLDGTTTIGTLKLRAKAVPQDIVSMTTRSIPPGWHEITAVYSGDTRYAPATSNVRTVSVYRGRTTTALRAARLDVPTGTTARFIAQVRAVAPAFGAPTGSVRFTAGSVVRTVPVDAKGIAMWKPRLPDGVYQVTARFEANELWHESTSPTVVQLVGPDGPRIDQGNTTRSDFNDIAFSTSGTYRGAAQIVVAGIPGMLTAVEVDAACFGGVPGRGGTGDLPVQIKSPIGDAPTGALLSTSPGPVSYDEELELARYELTTPVPVSVGTRIAIVLDPPANVMACTAGMAADGASAFSFGGGWQGRAAAIRHRTWVDPA